MKRIYYLLCVLFISGCASQQDLNTLKFEVDNQKIRVSKMEALLADKNRVIEQSLKQQADIQAKYAELQNQMLSIQGSLEEISATSSMKKGDANETRLSALEKEVQDLKQALGKGSSGQKTLYELGIDRYQAGKYEDAVNDFKQYLENNPDPSLVDNAHFWIGETLFALGKYEDAILRYDLVVKKYPNSDKLPECLLKQGSCFIKLGDKDTGELILKHLIQQYPDTDAASRAKKML